mmetsp:Transcript_61763/g.145582  ORF Transcript_61763/g.145582 Transcript_61763/m.145582 type:complete len:109 (+) Transcript_61763:99-425(+)
METLVKQGTVPMQRKGKGKKRKAKKPRAEIHQSDARDHGDGARSAEADAESTVSAPGVTKKKTKTISQCPAVIFICRFIFRWKGGWFRIDATSPEEEKEAQTSSRCLE